MESAGVKEVVWFIMLTICKNMKTQNKIQEIIDGEGKKLNILNQNPSSDTGHTVKQLYQT